MKFSAWAAFIGRSGSSSCYAPVAHWVFAPAGWLFERGALDFAGGTVVHINAGIAALAAILVLGKRKGWPRSPDAAALAAADAARRGHPVVRLVRVQRGLGARRATAVAAQAFVNTHLAAAAAMLELADRRAAPDRPRHHAGRGVGRRRRARRDHAVCRVRRRDVADLHRPRRRCDLLPRREP